MKFHNLKTYVICGGLIFLAGCDSEQAAGNLPPPLPVEMAVPGLRIGEVTGEAPYIFSRINGVALDDRGRILVADAQADEVRVFSPKGEFIFSLGGSGAGPGELSGPCCIAFGPEGDLWVRDGGNARYNRYTLGDSSASYVDFTRMSHSDVNYGPSTTFDAEGRLIDVGHVSDPSTGERKPVRFHVDSLGAVALRESVHTPRNDSIGVYEVHYETENGRGIRYLYQPYGPNQLIAHSPGGGWANGITSRYAIQWHLPNGKTHTVARPEITTGPELSDEERATAEERMNFYVEEFGVARMALPFEVPDNKTPIRLIHFDNLGRLWVELNMPDGQPRQAHVYEQDGSQVATISWPDNISIRAIYPEQNVALGIATDSMDVQRVVLLEIER